MAEYAILLYVPFREEAPTPEEMEPYDQHSEDLQRSGTMLAAYALEPATTATSLRGDLLTDGPFIESKEVVAGFYVIEAADLDEALSIARQNPILKEGGGLEVRPVAASVR